MVILPGIRVIVRRFLCIERRFLSDWSKKFYVDVLAQCAVSSVGPAPSLVPQTSCERARPGLDGRQKIAPSD